MTPRNPPLNPSDYPNFYIVIAIQIERVQSKFQRQLFCAGLRSS